MNGRTWKLPLAAALLALIALAACAGPTPGLRTTGDLRILAVEPDVTQGCPVRAGDWMALKGNDFGAPEDWGPEGPNTLLFPPEPGLAPETIELTRVADPATLFFRVPADATSGTIRLHVEGVGDAEFEVTVETGPSGASAVPGCTLPQAPPQD